MLQTTAHFAEKWSDLGGLAFAPFYLFPFLLADAFDDSYEQRVTHPWASALAFGLAGLVFIAIGLPLAGRRGEAAL